MIPPDAPHAIRTWYGKGKGQSAFAATRRSNSVSTFTVQAAARDPPPLAHTSTSGFFRPSFQRSRSWVNSSRLPGGGAAAVWGNVDSTAGAASFAAAPSRRRFASPSRRRYSACTCW